MSCGIRLRRSAMRPRRCDWPRATRESVHAATEMLERQVGQMVRLVDDLLDISRINRGKIELRKDQSNLRRSSSRLSKRLGRPLLEARATS